VPDLATNKNFANRMCGEVPYSVIVKPIGFEVQSMLWDLMSNMTVDRSGRQGADAQLGRVRDAVLYNGIERLEVDGKPITINASYALLDLPLYSDLTYRRTMPDELLRRVIEVNPEYGLEEPFDMVFRRYLPDELRNQSNPTRSGEVIEAEQLDTPPKKEESEQQQEEEEDAAATAPRIPSAR
jgi:hypothetical protein